MVGEVYVVVTRQGLESWVVKGRVGDRGGGLSEGRWRRRRSWWWWWCRCDL